MPNPTWLNVDPLVFKSMKILRLLIIRNAQFSTKIKYLPDSLKWIEWHWFAHRTLPSCFITKILVGLDLRHSFIKRFGRRLHGKVYFFGMCIWLEISWLFFFKTFIGQFNYIFFLNHKYMIKQNLLMIDDWSIVQQ